MYFFPIIVDNNTGYIGLTQDEKDTLSHIWLASGHINIEEDHLMTDLPFMTTLNSLFLGTVLKISSGGENVFFTLIEDSVSYFPSWSFLKDHRNISNHGPTGIGRTTDRKYSQNSDTFISGTLAESGSVEATNTTTLAENLMIFGYDTVLAEDYAGTLRFVGYYGTDTSERLFIDRYIEATGTITGESIELVVWPPAEIKSSTVIYIAILKDDNTPLLVRPTVENVLIPYFIRKYRSFEDVPLARVEEIPTSDGFRISSLSDDVTDLRQTLSANNTPEVIVYNTYSITSSNVTVDLGNGTVTFADANLWFASISLQVIREQPGARAIWCIFMETSTDNGTTWIKVPGSARRLALDYLDANDEGFVDYTATIEVVAGQKIRFQHVTDLASGDIGIISKKSDANCPISAGVVVSAYTIS